MESLASMTAAPVILALGGRSYRMSPLTLRDYAEIEQLLREERDGACDAITALDMAQWMSGVEGTAYLLWFVLRKRQPQLTVDDCRSLVAAEPDLIRLGYELDRASGLPWGNERRQAQPDRMHRAPWAA